MADVASLDRQVAAALRRVGLSGNGSLLVLGVSGGSDSSALLYSLHRLQEAHQLRLHVAHLNHNFRGDEADEDARFSEDLANELNLPFTVVKQDPTQYRKDRSISSFEQLAREMRYVFMSRVADELGAAAVAVGHTADDQAETVLQHVLRGSGLHGLQGMKESAPWPWPMGYPNLRIFRPLLGVTKADTVAYCRELGRDFRDDSGNYLPRFTRNRVRHQLMPLLADEFNPRVREALGRLARTAASDLDFIEGEVSRLWPELATVTEDAVSFDISRLMALHPALQRMVLRRGYSELTGDTRRLRESHLNAMAALISDGATVGTVELPQGARLHRAYERFLLSRETELACPLPNLQGEHPLQLPLEGGPEVAVSIDGWRVTMRAETSSGGGDGHRDLWNQPEESEQSDQSGHPMELPGESESGVVWSAWLDRESLGGELSLRTRRPGDRFQPLGMSREKKLQDFFTDAKVPRTWRDRVPLLVSERGIAWIAGHRIADWAALKTEESASRPVVWVELKPR
jgi:tRNA(Ile)-lysidine synthase